MPGNLVLPPPIPVAQWGRDHWSTFAYIETRIVDHMGMPDREHMRCDVRVHPQFGNSANRSEFGGEHPKTRTKTGDLDMHDDWSCLDDAEAAGLLVNGGTGLHRRYQLTKAGRAIAHALREHREKNLSWQAFTPPAEVSDAR